MVYSLSILGKRNYVFLASNFLLFVSIKFAMLYIFYKQLRLVDSAESCLWFWVISISCLVI